MDAAAESLQIAQKFLKDVGYARPVIIRDAALERAVHSEIDSWNLNEAELRTIQPAVPLGLGFIEYCWAHQPFELKLLNSLLTSIMFWFDDQVDKHLQACQEFQPRSLKHQPQLHPLFDQYSKLIYNLYDHYDFFVADQMVLSALQFPGACVTEYEAQTRQGFAPSKHASMFAMYRRYITAGSEYFAFGTWDKTMGVNLHEVFQTVPDQIVYLLLGNDVLSAKKEILEEDKHNLLTLESQMQGINKLAVLRQLSEKAASSFKNVSFTLANNPKAYWPWRHYSMAYIAFHLDVPRWQLPASLAGQAAFNGSATENPGGGTENPARKAA